ncbi:Phage-related protein [Vibrio cholerae]|nr:Phage-related protein [Vibrio cholerae]
MENSKEYLSLHGNKKCNECIIVLSDMLPEWAMYDNRRVIHIKYVNDIQRVLEYHKRGLIVKNWLNAIYISDEKVSFSMFNNFFIYKGSNISNIKSMLFHDLDGNVIFEFLSNPLIEDITFNYYLSVYKFLIRHNASNFCTSMAMLKARKSVKDQFSQEDIDSAIAFSLDLDLTSVVEIKKRQPKILFII